MGLYDSFLINDFVCPSCGHKHDSIEFQTKSLESLMESWKIGDRVAYSQLRMRTKQEKKDDLKKYIDNKGDRPRGRMSVGFFKVAGCLRKSGNLVCQQSDQHVRCYTPCQKCKAWIEAISVIENGIFKEIKNITFEARVCEKSNTNK